MNYGSLIKLAFVGDICLAGQVEQYYRNKGGILDKKVLENVRGCDAFIGNLESPISSKGQAFRFKHNTIRAHKDMGESLSSLKVNLYALANNHLLDYGLEAMAETLHILNRNKIDFVGAGMNIFEARRPKILNIKKKRIGFLNYTYAHETWASSDKYGTAREIKKEIIQDIHKIKDEADLIVLILHTGTEYSSIPTVEHVTNCREYIDNGVNIVIGHHPHVLQGVEKYKKGFIAYSLGNFIFDPNLVSQRHAGISESCILKLSLNNNGVERHEFVPLRIDNNGIPRTVNKSDHDRIINHINQLSDIIEDPSLLKSKLKGENKSSFKHQLKIVIQDLKEKGFSYFLYLLKTRRIRKRHIQAIINIILRK